MTNLTENSKYQFFLNSVFIEKIEKDIKKQRVFNYGCGNPESFLNTEIRRLARDVVDYDINIDGINVMEKEIFNTFDVVIAARVYEELTIDEQREFLQNCDKLLKPNGFVIILIPNARVLNRQMGVLLDILESPYELSPDDKMQGHVEMYSEDSINERLDKLNALNNLPFELEDILHIGYKPYPMPVMDTLPEAVYVGGQKLLECDSENWDGCAEIVTIWRKVKVEKTIRVDLDWGNKLVILILKESMKEYADTISKELEKKPSCIVISEDAIKDIITIDKGDPNIGIAGNDTTG